MALFDILTPPDGTDPFDARLIEDRFSWGAVLLPPVWALMHGLWLEMFGWTVGVVLIVVLGLFVGGAASVWLYVLLALWYGFAASDLRIAALKRTGYIASGTRIAEDEFLAERDFIAEKAQ